MRKLKKLPSIGKDAFLPMEGCMPREPSSHGLLLLKEGLP